MKASRYRFRILALLFVATTINYLDRSIIGVLGPTLQYKVFQWSDVFNRTDGHSPLAAANDPIG